MPWPPPQNNSTAPRGPISSSAPPTYRVKKKKPGESDPAPMNNGRMTGPPVQMGAGKGSMFADGRKGEPQGGPVASPNYPRGGPGPMRVQGQPQSAPPMTPNYPRQGPGPGSVSGQAQGAHPRGVPTSTAHLADGRKPNGHGPRMMADGDMPAPDAIGGEPDADDQGPMPGDGSDPSQAAGPAMGGGMPPIIKPEALNYHDDLWQCSGCSYFGDGGQCQVLAMQVSPTGACNAYDPSAAGGDQGAPDTGAGFTQNPEGTSGAPSLS